MRCAAGQSVLDRGIGSAPDDRDVRQATVVAGSGRSCRFGTRADRWPPGHWRRAPHDFIPTAERAAPNSAGPDRSPRSWSAIRLFVAAAVSLSVIPFLDGAATGADTSRFADTSAAAIGRPNIVVLMLDDVGANDGRVWERLPTIRKRFLENGIAFTDFHGETPTCCPGGVGFLTGLHTDAHGVTHNDGASSAPR